MDEPISILYEDNHLLAVNKPSGLLTQPTNLENESLELQVKSWIKKRDQKPGNVFATVVHRLDKPASGIVLFAKTSKALSRLNEAMRSREIKKIYYALVEGILKKKQDTLIHFLKHESHFSSVSDKNDPLAKRACLHYETLKEFKTSTLLQITLETGRYHQIRCQLSAIGHPIIGDVRYGGRKDQSLGLPANGIALHHSHMQFTHPVTKQTISLEAPLPPYYP